MSEPKAPITIAEIFEKLERGIKKFPDDVKEIDATYQFLISGDQELQVHVNLKDNPQVLYGEFESECTIRAKDRDFLKVYRGITPGFKAVLSGKLKVSGKLELATKLGDVFDRARGKKR